MGTRKQVRQRLAELCGGIGFNIVYDYAPSDFNGATKVLCIYSDNTRHDFISQDLNNNFYAFFLDVFVQRYGAYEDTLDDLHEALRSTLRAAVSDTTWSHLDFNEISDAFFAEVSGVPYRVERHSLIVKVN